MTKYLEVNNLSYSYPDGHEALKNISFVLDKKESLAILGPNGAGKTTLILHLNGILGNLDKEIKVSNFEYTDENIADIRKTVGVVFQDPDDQLFMPTVVEDVIVKPKQGKILIFSNGIMKHKVKKIKKNNRFMLAGWYK